MQLKPCDRVAKASSPGPLIRSLISPSNSSASAISCAEAVLVPGAYFREHYHLLAEEVYYILQGNGEVFVQGETKRVKAGDAVFIPPGQRHRVWNSSAEDLVLLIVSTPPHSMDDEYSTEI